MSETKWTPGPWEVQNLIDFELAIVEAGKPAYEWRFIATCDWPEERGDIPISQVIANARLITSAPDLYKAALDALHVLEGLANGNFKLNAASHKSAMKSLREETAKARGE